VLHEGLVIGYIAVNFCIEDLELARQAIAILTKTGPQGHVVEHHLAPGEVIGSIIEASLHTWGRPAHRLSRSERIELLRRLRERGALNMRGAVEQIAASLDVSRAAIYNYLREID
jgi:predicted transcriptional regulator YheO